MNRRIGLILLAAVLALVGTFAVYSYAHNADKRALEKTRSAKVLYAQKNIPVGTSWADAVKGDYLRTERVPIEAAPSTAISDTNASIPLDEVATSDIAAGQIAVREMFAKRVVKTGALAIPKGMQAMSVSVPANADASGFVQNGSEVAIYGTFKLGGNKNSVLRNQATVGGGNGDNVELWTTKMLLPRVTVLAVSQTVPTDSNKSTSSQSSTTAADGNVLVTVAVDQKSAQRLILAQQIGSLYMSLLDENSVSATDGGTLNIGIFKPSPIFVK